MQPLKVVITGASGFLGGYVLRLMSVQENVQAIAVTRKDVPGFFRVHDYSQTPIGDILIHLAENNDRGVVAKSGQAYEDTVLNTLHALVVKGYQRVVYASSSVLYGDADIHAHYPTDPIQINDSYTRIKRLSELEVLSLPGGVATRLANVYGPGMSKNNVMSTILRQIPGEGALEVIDKNPVRDFVWVEDAAEGVVALALSNLGRHNEGGLFNLGTGVGTSIGGLAEVALKIAGEPDRLVRPKQLQDLRSTLILDSSATTAACGWYPKTPLWQGLTHLINRNQRK
jgi:UDP-glucose 4-epimerase